jgi:predicted deacylase
MYTYETLLKDIDSFKNVSVENIGISWGGRVIPCVHTGSFKGKQIIVCGAIHAREHITARLISIMIGRYSDKIDYRGGIYFIPMANPDGVDLCIRGLKSVKSVWDRRNLLKINNGRRDFSLWKANLNGVDLNVNFDARYGRGKFNVIYPSSENFIGDRPFSEPESRALRDFTLKVKPSSVLCYHCKGEIIYWKFYQKGNLLRDMIIARALANATGYSLIDDEAESAGGYKDWCIEKLDIPAFTIEVGNDSFPHPFPYSETEQIVGRNMNVPALLLEYVA